MTSRKSRVAALVTVALLVFLSVGCTREAASDPLAGTATAASQSALPSNVTSTPAEFPTATLTSAVVINPTAAPTVEIAQVTPTPTTPAQPTATPTTPAPTLAPGAERTYVVKPGDRLFSIGRQFGVNPFSIAQANNIAPPYVIHPGDTLKIPGGGTPVTPLPPGSRIHVVAPGENLFRIALRYGTTVQALAAANNIANVNLIFVGDQLRIP